MAAGCGCGGSAEGLGRRLRPGAGRAGGPPRPCPRDRAAAHRFIHRPQPARPRSSGWRCPQRRACDARCDARRRGVLAGREAACQRRDVAALAIKVSTAFIAPFALLGSLRRGRFLIAALIAFRADRPRRRTRLWLELAGSARARRREPVKDQPPQPADPPSRGSRACGKDAARIGALLLYAAGLAYLFVWTWRGGDWLARGRLGLPRPACSQLLAFALVSDLDASPDRPFTRSKAAAAGPGPDRLPARRSAPYLTTAPLWPDHPRRRCGARP